ncbi:MAG: S-layer homology domain-containing protein [Sedimentibacter sp.]
MKRIAILTITLIFILNNFNIIYGAESKYLRAEFTEENVSGTNFKQITIAPYRYDGEKIEDEDDISYYIYLPSGYLVEGKEATYVADRDGEYPFTVYYGSHKKTFTYKTKGIDSPIDEDEDENNDDTIAYYDYNLMYDYEKKQVLFNMHIDKLRNVTTPEGTFATNKIIYYIDELENNIPYDLEIKIDDETFKYKIIKSGEFYLLIYMSPVNYNDYSTLVEYRGYNFTTNDYFEAYPPKDIYDDNGNYEVAVKSDNSQHVFSFNITGIDYRRPIIDISILDDETFKVEAEDDYGLDYIITFDGQYVPVSSSSNTFSYNHLTEIKYNGEYIFTVVDKKGNRSIETTNIKSKRKPRKHEINLEVHDFKNIDELFENIGSKYEKPNEDIIYFENILPAYMNGKSSDSFNPDSPISRAEMVTIFSRLNNLPYDTSAHLKTKFTDIDNHWARDYISMGSSKKYVSGYKDKTFKPDNNVTRAEFCQMLTKISSYKTLLNELPSTDNYNFKDINEHWAEKEIIRIASKNLIDSETDMFYPDRAITRGEVVHAINMLYGINPSYIELAHINKMYSNYYDFQDIEKHKYYFDIIISVVGMYREKVN